jgi:hypothetical protein
VDQEQVDVVAAQELQREVELAARVVRQVRAVVQLAGHEELVATQARRGDGGADAGLVAVHLGGVDVPVADLDGGLHGRLRLGRRHLEDPEAELRDGAAVVQRDGRYSGSHGAPRDRWWVSPTALPVSPRGSL